MTTPTITTPAITGGTIVNAAISGSSVTIGAGATLTGASLVNAALTGANTTIANATLSNTTVAANAVITLGDNANIATNATTGTVIATANTQKLGFYGATPVAQGAAINNVANDANSNINTVIQTLNALKVAIHNTGLIA